MFRKSRLFSIFNNKCPRCHEGNFFVHGNPYRFRGLVTMHPECPVCGLNYEPEPGYYFGAMFVSYCLNVAIFVTVWLAFTILTGDSVNVWLVVGSCILAGLMLVPITFRWSRLIWINLFVKYRPAIEKK